MTIQVSTSLLSPLVPRMHLISEEWLPSTPVYWIPAASHPCPQRGSGAWLGGGWCSVVLGWEEGGALWCLAGRRVALCGAGMASVLAPEPLCSPDFPGCSCAMWLLLLSYLVHRFQVLSTPLIHSIPLGDLIPPMSLSITYTLMIPTLISPVKASSLGFCIQVHPPRR